MRSEKGSTMAVVDDMVQWSYPRKMEAVRRHLGWRMEVRGGVQRKTPAQPLSGKGFIVTGGPPGLACWGSSAVNDLWITQSPSSLSSTSQAQGCLLPRTFDQGLFGGRQRARWGLPWSPLAVAEGYA